MRTAIRPFVPAHDFALSKDYYRALGFETKYEDEQVAIFDLGGAVFVLQNYYLKAFAENCVNQLVVEDLDGWWTRTANLPDRFATPRPDAPTIRPWGLRVGFLHDPSGVLWHVCDAAEIGGD